LCFFSCWRKYKPLLIILWWWPNPVFPLRQQSQAAYQVPYSSWGRMHVLWEEYKHDFQAEKPLRGGTMVKSWLS
jgi:hypothetical protein